MPSDIGLSISSSMRAAFIMAPSLSNRRTEVLSAAVEMGVAIPGLARNLTSPRSSG